MNYIIIESDAQMTPLMEAFSANPEYISFDTEFLRERTYYPVLCLLQLCIDGKVFLVDALAKLSMEKIISALVNAECPVICHAGSEDMEIITGLARKYGLSRLYPKNFYDLQTASAFVNADSGVGLGALVEKYLGIVLDKSETRSDWTRRPLSDEQLSYAVEDVIYLKKIYDIFNDELRQRPDVASFLRSELESESLRYTEIRSADTTYLKLKGTGKLNSRKLRIVHALCSLRQQVCEYDDIPLSFFIKNTVLVKLADAGVFNLGSLIKAGVNCQIAKKYGDLIIRTALKASADKSRPVLKTFDSVNQHSELRAVKKELENYAKKKAGEFGIARELVVSRRLLEDFMYTAMYADGVKSLIEQGWRAEMLGSLDNFRSRVQKLCNVSPSADNGDA